MAMFDIVSWGAISFGFVAVIQILFATFAILAKTDKVTDFSASVTFIVVAVLGLVWVSDYFPRQVVLSALVLFWTLRLGIYLTTRVLIRGKDSRFDEIRAVWWKFAFFWSMQITWIWVVYLPVMFITATHENKALSACDYVGWSIWAFGLLMESVADFQRVRFNRRKDADKPKFLNYGLWRYSRHPNYFGEITVWVGIWLSSSYGLWGIDTAYGVLGLFSPLLTFVLLAFITGIPRAEKRDDERYQQYEEYHEYKKQTSPLWPFPTSLYKHMPMVLRKVPFIDIRDYTKLTKEPAPDAINEATGIPAPREPNLQANQ